MIETIPSLQQAALQARLAQAAITLAQHEAEKAVKQALKGQGLKPQYIARREIVTLAKEYLAAHPELIAEAKPVVEQWRSVGFFGKKAARDVCGARASVERNSCTEWGREVIKGYARVSTDGQDLATQHELLKAAGAELVYSEKQSGIKTDRATLARCLASLEPGDAVLVTKLDRLARSGDNRRSWGELQIAGRSLGRYHHSTWAVDADGAWRIGRV